MFSFERFELDKDKANHFLYGSVITMFGIIFGMGIVWSLAICLVVAVMKEIWDFFYGSGFDWLDIFWTLMGSVVVVLPFFLS